MKKAWLTVRYLLEYAVILAFYALVRIVPLAVVRALAWILGAGIRSWPSARKLALANLAVAFPEWSVAERKRVMKASFHNLGLNLLEFIWMNGHAKRIARCCAMPPETHATLDRCTADGGRIIFVNPHLGSWEASGIMAPFFGGVRMAAIAKPLGNPYINRFFNHGNRENVKGLRVIFARGAMRGAIRALHENYCLGILIDQNTRVREGGTFVNFFGLPVPSSKAPPVLVRLCRTEKIPVTICFGASVRLADGKVQALAELLSKPFDEYANDEEILQELFEISERYIRRFPEQYLWFYRRYNYIPIDATPELAARYPYYAERAKPSFYDAAARHREKKSAAQAQ